MSSCRQRIALAVVAVTRRAFRGTWFQQLPMVTSIYRAVMRAGLGRVLEHEVVFRGARFLIPSKDVTILPSLLLGDYESTAIEAFLRLVGNLPPGSAILDVGGNIGLYTVLAGQVLDNRGTVFAFEPVPANARLLQTNLRLNNISNSIVIAKAVGNCEGTTRIFLSSSDVGTHSLASGVGPESEEVQLVSIDHFIEDRFLNVGGLKIDVEGYDGYVLEGARKLLSEQRPFVLVEYTPAALEECSYPVARFIAEVFAIPGRRYWIDERNRRLILLRKPNDLKTIPCDKRSSSNILITRSSELIEDLL